MAPGEHRPHDEEYWIQAWASVLFSGDLFEAIPFGAQPTEVVEGEDEAGSTKHYVGEVSFAHGLLISPTCDMQEQRGDQSQPAHPFRVLVPVLPLGQVAEALEAIEDNLNLIRSRDSVMPYMYLPALEGHLEEESVACLFRPSVVSDDFLREPPRRIAQMHPEARRQLKLKLAAYWARTYVERDELHLYETFEGEVLSSASPPSPYDTN